jgi:hypothetical protein
MMTAIQAQIDERREERALQMRQMDLQEKQLELQQRQLDAMFKKMEEDKEERERQGREQHMQLVELIKKPQAQVPHDGTIPTKARPRSQGAMCTKDAVARFVRHYFHQQRPYTKSSVSDVMFAYEGYAEANNLPAIDTRMKLVRGISNASTRLTPDKTDGRISGWFWI